jgi:hypothetical protein
MKLRELFNHLAFSELAQLNGINTSTGLIEEKSYDRVLSAISLGLTALHARFLIKQEEITIKLQPGLYSYKIHNAYALSSGNTSGYIQDSLENPYKNTLMKIEKVQTDYGLELTLNDPKDPYSIYTWSMDSITLHKDLVDKPIELPSYLVTDNLKVIYRANHFTLPIGFNGYDPDKVEIQLPHAYVEALLYFVGSRLHNPMGLVQDFNAGNNYAAKYERACQDIERNNIRIDNDTTNYRLVRGGWV